MPPPRRAPAVARAAPAPGHGGDDRAALDGNVHACARRQSRARQPVRSARCEPAPDRGGARRDDRAGAAPTSASPASRRRPRRARGALQRFYADAAKPLVGRRHPAWPGRDRRPRNGRAAASCAGGQRPPTAPRCCGRAAPTCTVARPTRSRISKRSSAHDITFGIGPAGTGKTYLAVACAVDALERDAVKRIVLVRPAVEAGERLGFLPGDLAQKVDPYLRPLYDALYDLMGFDKVGEALRAQHDRDRAAGVHARAARSTTRSSSSTRRRTRRPSR